MYAFLPPKQAWRRPDEASAAIVKQHGRTHVVGSLFIYMAMAIHNTSNTFIYNTSDNQHY